jgi:hypothetical protein
MPLYQIYIEFKEVELIEPESRIVVARGWSEGEGDWGSGQRMHKFRYIREIS